MDIFEEVLNTVQPADNIFVGVSGGADSMVLLTALLAARRTKDFDLHVIHVEHGIRGKDSLNDANFVAKFCKQHAVDCIIRHVDVPSLCATAKQTIEEAARAARYDIFASIVPQDGKLYLAHNATDQAETVLMHIFRGAGIDGACGMPRLGRIIRPLLDYTKADILKFAEDNKIKYVQDVTNNDNKYARNYVRNNVLDGLEKVYPGVVANINKFAGFCGQAEDLILGLVQPEWLTHLPYGILLAAEAFSAHSLVLAKAIKLAYNSCGRFADLESVHVSLICDLQQNKAVGALLSLAHGVVCEKRPEGVLFYVPQPKIMAETDLTLGPNNLPDGGVAEISLVKKAKYGDGNLYIDWQKVPAGSRWRTRRDGDMFAKFGCGSKKLNDYFTDSKVANAARDSIVVLANGNTVLCVLGLQISNSVKVDKSTTQIAKIDYRPSKKASN